MKKIIFFTAALIFGTSLLVTGQVPKAFKYQAVIRNQEQQPISDNSISVNVQIWKYEPVDTMVFEETFYGVAAENGLVNLQIGTGNPEDFTSIDWADGPYFIKVDYDLESGNNFTDFPASQLLSVPYALYAENSGNSVWTIGESSNISYSDGRVGIGTDSPDKQLHLLGDGYIKLQDTSSPDGTWSEVNAAPSGKLILHQHDENGGDGIAILANGNVGVGTLNPEARLHVRATDVNLDSGGALVLGYLNYTNLAMDSNEIMARDSGNISPLYFQSEGGDVAVHAGLESAKRFVIKDNGNVGIGKPNPQGKLHIWDTDVGLDGGGGIILGHMNGKNLALDQNEIMARDSGNISPLFLQSEGGDFHVHAVQESAKRFVIKDNGNVGIGMVNPDEKLHVNGTTKTKVLEITGGSDLSESSNVVSKIDGLKPEAGMLVSIDPDSHERLMITQDIMDKKVVGVISGANGINPGMTMRQEGTIADGKFPVALVGRVYVKADTSNGTIEPGDMLTSSAVPGYAMKVTDHESARGAIIGKAMSGLKDERGFVWVLVSLQ